jgi:CubicO group peptidase (beta-lactamase class C family)
VQHNQPFNRLTYKLTGMKQFFQVLLLLALHLSASAQDSLKILPVTDDTQQIVAWLRQKHIPALAIGVIHDGQLQQVRVYGELKAGTPAPYDAVFNVASLTKPIVTLVTLNLVSSGRWKLDEPVARFWTDPDIKDDPRSKKLTTRDILTHRTGFPNWRSQLKDGKLAFQFDPGTKYQYSGEGFEYLRRALQARFHRSLEQLADSIIFKPLGMKDTRLTWDSSFENRFAYPHNPKGQLLEPTRNKEANAADLLKTTISDYGKFLVWVLNGGGLSPELFAEMSSHQVQTKENVYMGLGWAVYDQLGNGEYALSHSGRDPGANTIAFMLPKSKRGLLIFTNSDNGALVYTDLVKTYLKEQGEVIIAVETKNKPGK